MDGNKASFFAAGFDFQMIADDDERCGSGRARGSPGVENPRKLFGRRNGAEVNDDAGVVGPTRAPAPFGAVIWRDLFDGDV